MAGPFATKLSLALCACLLMHGTAVAHPANATNVKADKWDVLRDALTAWNQISFDDHFAVNVGDGSGTLFTWTSPGFTMNKMLLGASLSKWPSAVMISGLVADGIMDYDDQANKYLEWWPKSNHNAVNVTLRQLLSFTSGAQHDATEPCLIGFMHCAEEHFREVVSKSWAKPGTVWKYLSIHLQLAGAMAVAASGKPIEELYETYLYKRHGMNSTVYGPTPWNPSLAGGILTNGADFESMLHSLLTYKGLPESVVSQMEMDYTKAPVHPSGDGWFGHYAMSHWWECLGYGDVNERTALPPICTDAHIQGGPGAFGYYPLIDRSGGGGRAGPKRPPYYFQVVLQETDKLSGIPEYLRIVAKPVVDIIMSGGDPTKVSSKEIQTNGGGLLRRDIDFIRGELGKCECSLSSSSNSPYDKLTEKMPADVKKKSRYDLLAEGKGITLLDIADLVKRSIGTCRCPNRG